MVEKISIYIQFYFLNQDIQLEILDNFTKSN